MSEKLWTIKPHTVYAMAGRLKLEFRKGNSGRHMIVDVTEHEGTIDEITSRVRFLTGGEVIRIEKLTR